MTEDERELLVQTAKAVAALSMGCASGYGSQEFTEQYHKISGSLLELVKRIAVASPRVSRLIG